MFSFVSFVVKKGIVKIYSQKKEYKRSKRANKKSFISPLMFSFVSFVVKKGIVKS
jgi:hypothetical protein